MCLSEIDCEARFNMHVPRVQSAVMTLEGNKNTDLFCSVCVGVGEDEEHSKNAET